MPVPKREKIERKIEKIKKLLAADKRKWGAWDDSRGLRYLPPGLYIQIEDWAGGLKYLKWFEKNFPDDMGMPEFLFEWTIILFNSNKIKEAESKTMQTFFQIPICSIHFLRSWQNRSTNGRAPTWNRFLICSILTITATIRVWSVFLTGWRTG